MLERRDYVSGLANSPYAHTVSSQGYAAILAALLVMVTATVVFTGTHRRLPVLMHNGAWIFALVTIASGLVRYTPASVYAWVLLTAGIALFNVGVFIASAIHPKPRPPLKDARAPALLSRRSFYILLSLYAAGILFYITTIATRFGLGTFLSNPQLIRGSDYLITLPLPAKLLIYLGPLLLVVLADKRLIQPSLSGVTRVVLSLLVLISMASQLQRVLIFIAVLWVLGTLLLREPERRPQRTEWSRRGKRVQVIVAVALAIVAFQVIGGLLGKTTLQSAAVRSAMSPSLATSPLAGLAIYGSSSVSAFSQMVESDLTAFPPPADPRIGGGAVYGPYNPHTWGAATFGSLLKIFPIAKPFPNDPFVGVPFPTNTYTWLAPFYRDFREPGILLLSFAFGVTLGELARRKDGSAASMLLAGLFLGTTALATFANVTTSVPVLELAAILLILGSRAGVATQRAAQDEALAASSGGGSQLGRLGANTRGRKKAASA